MDKQRRFTATSHLKETLARRERSGAWLSRKIGVSQQLMSFVLRNERTIAEDKAMRAAAILDEPLDFLFAPVVTSVTFSDTDVAA